MGRTTDEPGHNYIGLYDTSLIQSDILWDQFFVTVKHNIALLSYNDTRL
jgi:hypothetical protein